MGYFLYLMLTVIFKFVTYKAVTFKINDLKAKAKKRVVSEKICVCRLIET
jgi:hypothetical protein